MIRLMESKSKKKKGNVVDVWLIGNQIQKGKVEVRLGSVYRVI